MTYRETFEQWAAKQWGSDAWRHTSATSGEWEAFQAGCDMGRQAELPEPALRLPARVGGYCGYFTAKQVRAYAAEETRAAIERRLRSA